MLLAQLWQEHAQIGSQQQEIDRLASKLQSLREQMHISPLAAVSGGPGPAPPACLGPGQANGAQKPENGPSNYGAQPIEFQ